MRLLIASMGKVALPPMGNLIKNTHTPIREHTTKRIAACVLLIFFVSDIVFFNSFRLTHKYLKFANFHTPMSLFYHRFDIFLILNWNCIMTVYEYTMAFAYDKTE